MINNYNTRNMHNYFIKDYLGNNRVVLEVDAQNKKTVTQRMQYYPFGLQHQDSYYTERQPYKFGGKELDEMFGLNYYNQGARFFGSVIPVTPTQDPMAEKYYAISPYAQWGNNPAKYTDPDGRDAIFIAFPDYKISTPIGQLNNLGHAGVLLIDNKTGLTKYYEYGRYDKEGKGEVRTRIISNVKIGNDGKPTAESLNKVLKEISDKAGQGGKIEGAYVESDMFKEMRDYAESKKSDNNNPDRKKYSLRKNNCGTFAADVIKQDPDSKKDVPTIIDPRPNSMVKEYQKKFKPISYNPEKYK